MDRKANKKVLVSALDWGLGHASRMVPVIHHLLGMGFEVMLGGSGNSMELLKQEFPDLETEWLPSPRLHYSAGVTQVPGLLRQVPRFIYVTIKEHLLTRKIVKRREINIIISDNRYGVFSKEAYSVLVTHQISPVLPEPFRFLEYPAYVVLKKMISRFNECWIPDTAEEMSSLTGLLSHRFKLPSAARYIGILTFLADEDGNDDSTGGRMSSHYDIAVILSGPEPQKTILFRQIMRQLRSDGEYRVFMAGGWIAGDIREIEPASGITLVRNAGVSLLRHVIRRSEVIICRPGYTSLMDLVALRKPAILIPTPGQPEQEYLAERLSAAGYFLSVRQQDFRLEEALKSFREKFTGAVMPDLTGQINNIPLL
jgi:UDP:flavonoid glycosyltransferase YjiC (YdhE family)